MSYPLILPLNQYQEAKSRSDEMLPLVPVLPMHVHSLRRKAWKRVETFVSEECDQAVIDRAKGVGAIVHVVQAPVFEQLHTWKQAILDRLLIKAVLDSNRGACLKWVLKPILESHGFTGMECDRMILNAEVSGLIAHKRGMNGLIRWTNKYDGLNRRKQPNAKQARVYRPRERFAVTPTVSVDDGREPG